MSCNAIAAINTQITIAAALMRNMAISGERKRKNPASAWLAGFLEGSAVSLAKYYVSCRRNASDFSRQSHAR
jgi:hypothetical protein